MYAAIILALSLTGYLPGVTPGWANPKRELLGLLEAVFLQERHASCCQTNGIKALKGQVIVY